MNQISPSQEVRGVYLASIGFSLFALGDAVFKYLSTYYSISFLLFFNATFGMSVLLLASPWLGGLKATLQTSQLKLHLLRSILILIQLSLVVYGLSQMPMTKTYAIVFTAPLIATLLAIPLLKDPVNSKQWLAIAAGFVGVLVILRPGFIPLDLAALGVLIAALFFSLANIIVRFMRNTANTILSWVFYQNMLILFVTGCLLNTDIIMPPAEHLALFAFLGICSSSGAIFITKAFLCSSVATASSLHYIQMLWAAFLGYFIFHDDVDIWTMAGSVIIICSGIYLLQLAKKSE
ncbi:hypothetical protein MNBD_GAMMA16-280 [hydrothermal vent metagenome]|uniref:EamA domain-containing protein n=1 Tax=hydrothermal vent metagenome TaxID=652676 RepID=A0A3B0ZGK1_9ZZZZ